MHAATLKDAPGFATDDVVITFAARLTNKETNTAIPLDFSLRSLSPLT